MRKVSVILLTIILLSTSLSFAATQALKKSLALTFSGTTANCEMNVEKDGASITAKMELWQGTTKLHEWSGAGSDSVTLSGNHNCVSGISYELRGSGKVNGVSFNITPVTRICP